MRKAVIDNETKIVENIILAVTNFTLPGKTVVDAEDAEIGDSYIDKKFVKPEPSKERE
jgi:hypothetical protein